MLANHKGEIPFILLLIPFLLGIVVGLNFASANYFYLLVISLLVVSLAFIGLNLAYNRLSLYRFRWLGGLLMSLILLFAGWLSVVANNELNHPDHFSKTPSQYLVVRVNNEPVLKNGLVRFT